MAIKNTPFKMKSSPAKLWPWSKKTKKTEQTKSYEAFTRTSYSPPSKTKRKPYRKAFKYTKVGKFLGFGGGSRGGGSSTKLGCGPRGCRN